MHSLKNKKQGGKGWFALKPDMAKAYDRLEWRYIEAVLMKFGFHPQWVRWAMNCVETVSFAVIVIKWGQGGFLYSSMGYSARLTPIPIPLHPMCRRTPSFDSNCS
ncbi:hypothetical protein Vadar_022695 [Vaccinium darrowii]|uniref:Uncharacterized protein n=1 Tax=Vaccinium darrowii TaxID=229202 RepID=A0ACB7Y1D3_9ERIC|nr:hypothetical protein Vadar_022695 [Vaccinium darrowii]